MQDERVITIDINLTRGLVAMLALALLAAALLGYLAWGRDEAAASGPQIPLAASSGMRQYYLTKTYSFGADADDACASGYHMASLWEIVDPSNLKYNTDLGVTWSDSGQGPSSYTDGWVRTGYVSSADSVPGWGNCNAWTSSASGDLGTLTWLPLEWGSGQDIHVWEVGLTSCQTDKHVWCVED
jgi:hypothetical protein